MQCAGLTATEDDKHWITQCSSIVPVCVCFLQAEQFANELTRHLGIAAPDCRIVRQVGSAQHAMLCHEMGRQRSRLSGGMACVNVVLRAALRCACWC